MSVVFFSDRDLGLKFPEILRDGGLSVETHRDHFPPTCADDKWLAAVGAKGWVALTHDGRIRYKPNELAQVIRHRVTLLVVVGKAPYPLLARSFVATIPQVMAFLSAHKPPLIGKVYRATPADLDRDPDTPGRVELWYPKSA